MSFIKALIPGLILTLVVAALIGHGGSAGGFLYIHKEVIRQYDFYWSWSLFIASVGLAWGLFWMME
jgi:hypothetical protein